MAARPFAHGSVWLLVLLVWGGGVRAVHAQSPQPSSEASAPQFCADERRRSLDARGLASIYCTAHSPFTGALEGAHRTARPAFYGAVPAAWAGAALTQEPAVRAAAYRLTLSQGLTYGLVVGTKHLVGRPRPYVHRSLEARTPRHDPPAPGDAHLSFPSGHAALSAALVTSWARSYPRWYVVGPGALWATSVALSRVHLGVHYPSDVLVGTVVGVGVGLLVHQLGHTVTPGSLRASPSAAVSPPLLLRVTF